MGLDGRSHSTTTSSNRRNPAEKMRRNSLSMLLEKLGATVDEKESNFRKLMCSGHPHNPVFIQDILIQKIDLKLNANPKK